MDEEDIDAPTALELLYAQIDALKKDRSLTRKRRIAAIKQAKREYTRGYHVPKLPSRSPIPGYADAVEQWRRACQLSQSHHRRAARLGAKGSHTPEELADMLKKQDGKCYYCGRVLGDRHLGHKTPLCRGGTNDIDNLAWSCPQCNLSKGPLTENEFRRGAVKPPDPTGKPPPYAPRPPRQRPRKRKGGFRKCSDEERIRQFEDNPAPVEVYYIDPEDAKGKTPAGVEYRGN